MKKNDLTFILILAIIVVPLLLWDKAFNSYLAFNGNHGMITSFIKFGLLATLGEIIGLRIRAGVYIQKGFGILPKIIVWGFLGLTIKIAFIIFATGTPIFLNYMGLENATAAMKSNLSWLKLGVAFTISAAMNIIYAPIMMTTHKITDIHIAKNNGKFSSLFIPIDFAAAFNKIDWNTQWHFIFKKTIPFFWIPAHTITFLLPADFQVLFAALLSVVLGLILAFASLKSEK
jgi:hypothetical protein